MHRHYKDILDKIEEAPQWFDENGVPRYCAFAPQQIADIYADEVALLLIACQNCGQRFEVVVSSGAMDNMMKRTRVSYWIEDGTIHYGDPPNIQCCPAGPTMNCEDIRVLQFWRRGRLSEWERDSAYEIALPGYEEE